MILSINKSPVRKLAALLPFMVIFLMACEASATPASSTEQAAELQAVATTSIVADWTRRVGGERVEVFSLLPVGADAHSFQPGARDISRVADADIVFSVGLTLEAAWLDELIRNAAADTSRIVALGELVDPIEFTGHDEDEHEGEEHEGEDEEHEGEEHEGEEHEEDEHGHGALDPHFWFDPVRVKIAVTQIAERLAALDPEDAEQYRANASAYNAQLDELHAWIQQQVAQVPPERRLLVTSHETLGYFGERYGFEVVGTVIPGVTTEREPSAQELAELVGVIREHNAPAIFAENVVSDQLARQIADEAGISVVRSLYSESLGGPGSGADTYIGMVRANVEIIVEALR
ncbi:MAG: metal ABC transporter substrate-binding protein [Chloroflexi bacterium]|nr:metal ABC transporter substrate-binding protein [Chloroflexota bacterium]